MKSRNLKNIIMTLVLSVVSILSIAGLATQSIASERYVIEETTINITDTDISQAVALGASTVDVLPDRSMSYIGMGATNYGGAEAISATVAHTTEGNATMGFSAAKANGGSDFLFKIYGGFQKKW